MSNRQWSYSSYANKYNRPVGPPTMQSWLSRSKVGRPNIDNQTVSEVRIDASPADRYRRTIASAGYNLSVFGVKGVLRALCGVLQAACRCRTGAAWGCTASRGRRRARAAAPASRRAARPTSSARSRRWATTSGRRR